VEEIPLIMGTKIMMLHILKPIMEKGKNTLQLTSVQCTVKVVVVKLKVAVQFAECLTWLRQIMLKTDININIIHFDGELKLKALLILF
jgi:hypothetical protein